MRRTGTLATAAFQRSRRTASCAWSVARQVRAPDVDAENAFDEIHRPALGPDDAALHPQPERAERPAAVALSHEPAEDVGEQRRERSGFPGGHNEEDTRERAPGPLAESRYPRNTPPRAPSSSRSMCSIVFRVASTSDSTTERSVSFAPAGTSMGSPMRMRHLAGSGRGSGVTGT